MSSEIFEKDHGMLEYGLENALTDIRDALDHHCSKHQHHGSNRIMSIGMGKLPGEHKEAFRLGFQEAISASSYDSTHKAPASAAAEVSLGKTGFFTINVGQERMEFLLKQCGKSAGIATALIQKALLQCRGCIARK